MTINEKIIDIIYDLYFRSTNTYVKIGSYANSSLAAANKIATLLNFRELKLICELAICIEKNIDYDFYINEEAIIHKCKVILRYQKISSILNIDNL